MEDASNSPALVAPSLRALLHEIVDYAGLFPPADLPLRDALHQYADHRADSEAWMLSRFVLPVRRLPDLDVHQTLFRQGAPYAFSALGTGGSDADSFLTSFAGDLDAIEAFDEEHGGQAHVDVLEVALPPALLGSTQQTVLDFFERVDRTLVTTGTAKLDLFVEVPLNEDTAGGLPQLCAAVAEYNSRQAVPERCQVGLKMRCGGREPGDIPNVEHVAALITACRDAGIRFKATAGLHQPMRHYDDSMETEMHGFLNVFVAAAVAAEHGLDRGAVQELLLETNPENFQFLKEGLAWRDLTVPNKALHYIRETFATSFGSCSFEEPVNELRDLELI
jgi:hypothetical protein